MTFISSDTIPTLTMEKKNPSLITQPVQYYDYLDAQNDHIWKKKKE